MLNSTCEFHIKQFSAVFSLLYYWFISNILYCTEHYIYVENFSKDLILAILQRFALGFQLKVESNIAKYMFPYCEI